MQVSQQVSRRVGRFFVPVLGRARVEAVIVTRVSVLSVRGCLVGACLCGSGAALASHPLRPGDHR